MNFQKYAQLFLRLALGFGFIIPVLDRLGFLGPPGHPNVAWGDWAHFINYTSVLTPYLNKPLAGISGLVATVLEILFGLCLIVGYRTRIMALGGSILTLIFACSMAVFLGFQAPFNYSVFTCSAAGLVLASLREYPWSIDNVLSPNQ